MKTVKYFFYVLLVSLLAVSCDEREYDLPPYEVPEYTGDTANITIKALKAKFNGESPVLITDTLVFKAKVVGNDESGNIYKQIVVQDSTANEAGGIILSIDQSGLFGQYRVGQEIYVNLLGLYIGKYGREHQIGMLDGNTIGRMTLHDFEQHVSRNGLPVKMTPKTVKIDDLGINADSYVNTLIQIENVSFNNGGKNVFAPNLSSSPNATEELVADLLGKTLTVRTSKYADFAGDVLPKGHGTIVGVLGRYNGAWQFTLRSRNDLVGFENIKGLSSDNPFDVTTALAKEYSDAKFWTKGYIVGTVAAGVNSTNPIDAANDVALTADFLNTTILIAAGANETDFTKMLVVNLPENSAMRTALSLMDKPANKGKEVTVYGNFKDYFGAHSINIATGSASEFVFEGQGGEQPGVGTGTKEDPYNVAQAITKQGAAANNNFLWATGYVVGIYESKDAAGNDLYPNNFAKFVAPFYTNLNIFLADSPDETNTVKMVNVQLPVSMRDVLAPMNNAAILKQKVAVRGSFEKYNTFSGIKNLQEYVYDGGTTPPEPPTPPTPGDYFFTETFGNGDYPSGNRPKIAAFTDFDMKAPYVFSDQYAVADIRSTGTISPSVWLPAYSATFDATSQLKITGIAAGYTQMKLVYDIATNTTNGANANKIAVKCNDVAVTVPSTTFTANNAFVTITLDIPDNTTSIEFFSDVAINKEGYRLDNIKISGTK